MDSQPTIKLVNTFIGGYDVLVTDPDFKLEGAPVIDGCVKIGEVRKMVTRYNLRRSITTINWHARTFDGKRLPDAGGYPTRRDALAVLVREVLS
jgi:hypothetical protein